MPRRARSNQPIIQSYYEVSGDLICSHCRESLMQGTGASRGLRILRSAGAGLGAAVLGAIVWWGVRKLTGYQVGLISIGIGVAVGKAVRWGSFGRGGWAYQLLAVLLTYAAVAGNYVPDMLWGSASSGTTTITVTQTNEAPVMDGQSVRLPARYVVLFVVVYLAVRPFGNGIIGILIIAFGLFEAWKINKRTELTITGPFSVAPAPTPPLNV